MQLLRKQKSGFTLVEIMIVIAVIAILTSILAVGWGAWQRGINEKQVKSDMQMAVNTVDGKKNFENLTPCSIVAGFTATGTTFDCYAYAGDAYCIEGTSVKDSRIVLSVSSSDKTNIRTEPCGTAPNTPSLTASATSSTSIRVTWTAEPGVTYAVNFGESTPGTPAGCSASPCTVSSLKESTTYRFNLVATNAYGSATSPTVSATTPSGGTAPAAPSPSITGSTTSSLTVAWSNVTGATSYSVSTTPSSSANCSSSPCTISGLTSSTTYTVRVTATNSYGSNTGTTSGTTNSSGGGGTAPAAPSPNVTGATTSSLTVAWSSVSGATGYSVQYGTSSPTTSAGCSNSPCTISGLSASTTYQIRVTASNSYGSASGSTSGTTSSASTPATCSTAPNAPAPSTSAVSSTAIYVSWTKPSAGANCTDSYDVEYGESPTGGAANPPAVPAGCSSSCTISGLSPSTSYRFRVVVSNSYGSDTSNWYTQSTQAIPKPLAPNLSASRNSNLQRRATATWYMESGVTFNAGISEVSPCYGAVCKYGTAQGVSSPYVFDELGLCARFDITVVAKNSSGESSSTVRIPKSSECTE